MCHFCQHLFFGESHFIFKCAVFVITSVVPLQYVPFLSLPQLYHYNMCRFCHYLNCTITICAVFVITSIVPLQYVPFLSLPQLYHYNMCHFCMCHSGSCLFQMYLYGGALVACNGQSFLWPLNTVKISSNLQLEETLQQRYVCLTHLGYLIITVIY